jgi:hypothetical protein
VLVYHKKLSLGTNAHAQVGAHGRRFALLGVLFLDELEQRFRLALVVEQNPAEILPAFRQRVGVHIENFAAGVVPEDQRAGQLLDRLLAILRVIIRIAAAAIGGSDVEQAELGAACPCERIEGDFSPVVVGQRMRDPEQCAWGGAVVGCGFRILGGPFEQNLVVRVAVAERDKVRYGCTLLPSV